MVWEVLRLNVSFVCFLGPEISFNGECFYIKKIVNVMCVDLHCRPVLWL